jgi:hypothetical protein
MMGAEVRGLSVAVVLDRNLVQPNGRFRDQGVGQLLMMTEPVLSLVIGVS